MNMKLCYKLIAFLVLCLVFSFELIETEETYLYVNSSNKETAKITFGKMKSNSKKRNYTLEYHSHRSFGNITSECIYEGKFIELENKTHDDINKFSMAVSIKKKVNKNNQIEIQISKKLLPCWIKLDKSFLRVKSSNKLKILPQNDTLEITIISDIDKLKGFNHFKICKGNNVFIHRVNTLNITGNRGDLRPEIAKIQYGYFKNDTLEFYGKNDSIFRFIKL
jgi:hypothetical protein